jgi:L-amino acid N-acyltransferase YncA
VAPAIRSARAGDAAAIAEIYRPFCETTTVSFENEAPSAAEMAERIRTTGERYPWLVLEDGGTLAGYAYGSRHRERAAYGWAVDVTVYVAAAYQRRGVGRALYTSLLELLQLLGYFKAYAVITLPNPSSTGLHQAVGFEPVGVFKGVGYKLGAWRDVAHYQRALQPERPDPTPPRASCELEGAPEWNEALERGARLYKGEA